MTEQRLSVLLETLQPLEPRARAMFAGHGIYSQETFLAIYYDDRLYFRVDDKTRREYLDAGMKPLEPPNNRPIRWYYEVPDDVVASRNALCEWARLARDAAARR